MDVVNARILSKSDTTANWNANIHFIPFRGEIIVYSDYGHIDDGFGNQIDVPGIKIGDGNAYLIDLPFVGEDQKRIILQQLQEHANNQEIHISQAERKFWNNKLNCDVKNGNLIFNHN